MLSNLLNNAIEAAGKFEKDNIFSFSVLIPDEDVVQKN
jgi:hypothetical protein